MFKTENPLVPFIVFFAIVILLTIVITNSRNVSQPAQMKAAKPNAGLTLSPAKDAALDLRPKTKAERVETVYMQQEVDVKALLLSAIRDFENGDAKGAEEKFRTVLVFEPSNMRALSTLASMLFGQGRFTDAELFYSGLVKADPDNLVYYGRLATALSKQGKYADAIRCVEKISELNPDSGEVFVTLAGLHALAGDTQGAVDNFKTAYAKLGGRVLTFSDDPNLDSIKNDPQFKEILEQASSDMAEREAAKMEAPSQPPAPSPETPSDE